MTSARERRIEFGGLVFGAAAFLAAHLVLLVAWRRWFDPGGAYPVWFLNSGRAAAFTAVWLLAAAFIGTAFAPPARELVTWRILNVSAGAIAAMAVVLIVTGPGTIFPIVLSIGTTVVVAAVAAGTYAAARARR